MNLGRNLRCAQSTEFGSSLSRNLPAGIGSSVRRSGPSGGRRLRHWPWHHPRRLSDLL